MRNGREPVAICDRFSICFSKLSSKRGFRVTICHLKELLKASYALSL
jgi:hypothetical protein